MNSNNLSLEQEYIINMFRNNFNKFKDKSISLYGVGSNTKLLLENVDSENVIGLIDKETTGQNIFGKKVLSYEDVIEKVDIIIIIAKVSAVKIIYDRIKFLYKDYKIKIFNLEGELLNEKYSILINEFKIDYWNTNEKQLIKLIDENEIISFDIFDTLIMRKVLNQENIFDTIEKQLIEEYQLNIDFKRKRIEAEQKLQEKRKASNINEIYEELQNQINIDNITRDLIKSLEIKTELNNIIPRVKMVEILNYAIDMNKMVNLIVDTYFTEEIMKIILTKCEIMGYKELMISSATRKTKKDGTLFKYYREKIGKKKSLHIGDNIKDDIEMAKSFDIDTFHVMSSYEMLTYSSIRGFLTHVKGIESYNVLGLFIAKVFNNPFALNRENGKIAVDDIFEMAYLFLGPLITSFMIWLMQKLKELNCEFVVFSARDGYLIKNLYDILVEKFQLSKAPKSMYLKTSRRAVSVPLIKEKKDIQFILERSFNGTIRELLKSRFGIDVDSENIQLDKSISPITDKKEIEEVVMQYKDEIIKNAKDEYKSYMRYVQQYDIRKYKNVCIFDLVAAGSVQFYLEKLLDKELIGLYFATMNIPNQFFKDSKRIESAYGNHTYYKTSNNVGRYHIFLETILTDPNPMLVKCNYDGSFNYDEINNKRRDFSKIEMCQNGIKAFFTDMINANPNLINYNFDYSFTDYIFGMLFSYNCITSDNIKMMFDKLESEIKNGRN